jgi:hypothetical protein
MPGSGLGFGTGLGLRPIQTECDSTTRREFSVFKKIKPSTDKNFTRYADQIAKIA